MFIIICIPLLVELLKCSACKGSISVHLMWLFIFTTLIFLHPAVGIICLGECVDAQMFCYVLQHWPSTLLTHTDSHTHTFGSEGAQIQTLFLRHCYTNRLGEARGLLTNGVCTHTHRHTLIQAGTHVCQPPFRTWGMWKSLGDASTYVSLCPL